MRRLSLAVITVLALLPAPAAMADDATAYRPAKGDEVVVYTHRFKPENFAEGVTLVEEGFTAAQKAAGQTRHNYFLVNPTNYEIVVVSSFAPGSGVDEWHKFMGRLDLLKQLDPMRSEPLKLQRYTVNTITTVP